MDAYTARLEAIAEQIKRLSDMLTAAKEREDELLAEKEEMKRLLEAKNRTIEELQHQNDLLAISGKLKGGETKDTAELKKKINEFIKEIDKCVALLNN